ncbi:hypothetical protein GCM10010191_54970 [Actinomadura vinacea]|uniref:DUF3618 domain-containing protein n=1 Tax=Actinomadura vinacea TaxID=115336 RepID=A0ABN3JM70_9ACTN
MTQQRSRDAAAPAGTAELRAEIERTRRELGDTVEALAAKTDVKARARETADRMRTQVSDRARRVTRKTRAAGPQGEEGARPSGTMARRGATVAVCGAGVAVAVVLVRRRRAARRRPFWQRMMPARVRWTPPARMYAPRLPARLGDRRTRRVLDQIRARAVRR